MTRHKSFRTRVRARMDKTSGSRCSTRGARPSVRVRTTTAPKSFRADREDGSTRIAVGFVAEGEAKSQAGIMHERLANAEAAARMKAYWRERLVALKALLEV